MKKYLLYLKKSKILCHNLLTGLSNKYEVQKKERLLCKRMKRLN